MEDDNYDVYYVDGRNATPTVISRSNSSNHRPQTRVIRAPAGYQNPYGQQYMQPSPYAPGYAPVPYGAQSSIYAPPYYGQPSAMESIFGRLSAGEVISMIAQGFAALQGTPTPPVTTGDIATDIGNSIAYNTAVAEAVKQDERIRTVGSIVAKFLKGER